MQPCRISIKGGPKHRSPRKKLIRRTDRDHSQPLRFTKQILFATLNVRREPASAEHLLYEIKICP